MSDTVDKPSGRFTLVADELHDAFSRVQHAAATDPDRPVLTTILIERRADDLRFVAADNYRVALFTISDVFDTDDSWGQALLPMAALPAALAFLKALGENIVVTTRDGLLLSLVSEPGTDRLDIELLDATYPNVDVIFPNDPPHVASFNSVFLAGLVKGARKGIVRLSLADPLAPAVFRDPTTSFVELIMPVKENLTLDDAIGTEPLP